MRTNTSQQDHESSASYNSNLFPHELSGADKRPGCECRGSPDSCAAIDHDVSTRHERSEVSGKEGNDAANFVHGSETAHGNGKGLVSSGCVELLVGDSLALQVSVVNP